MPTLRMTRPIAAALSLTLIGCSTTEPFRAMDHAELRRSSEVAAARAVDGERAPTAPPSSTASASTVEQAAAATDRLMVYVASVDVVVRSVNDAIASTRRIGEGLGGYVQEMSADYVTLKIPAARFDEALTAVRGLGEVTGQQITGLDVTEQMLDFRIRLDTSEKMHARLLALLEKSEKVEDTLKIEQELARTVQTIEQLKGKIRLLSNQVAYSTLTARFNSPIPQDELRGLTPFPWVRGLGGDFVGGTRPARIDRGWFAGDIELDAPDGYIRYYAQKDETRTMSAGSVLTRVTRHENYPGGTLDFWSELIRRALVRSHAIALGAGETITLNDGTKATLLSGEKTIGGEQSGYLIVIAVRGDERVYTYEAWGPFEEFEADRAALVRSARTMRVR